MLNFPGIQLVYQAGHIWFGRWSFFPDNPSFQVQKLEIIWGDYQFVEKQKVSDFPEGSLHWACEKSQIGSAYPSRKSAVACSQGPST